MKKCLVSNTGPIVELSQEPDTLLVGILDPGEAAIIQLASVDDVGFNPDI